MVYGLLLTLFLFVCFLLISIILIQQSKSSMGLGSIGGSTQMLFGGSGGQDIFQKTTWVLGALFMLGSLGLTIYKTRQVKEAVYYSPRAARTLPVQLPIKPEAPAQTGE